jgi:hypothetical protein
MRARLATALVALGACEFVQDGIYRTADDAGQGPRDAGQEPAAPPADGAPEAEAGPPEDGPAGPPALLGCADGTREGFTQVADWPGIAGCSGGWSVPGLLSDDAATPRCGRAAGNTGTNPSGFGCSAADLCADGWHVCRGPDEVARASPTQCEGAIAYGPPVFFAARAGASEGGFCVPSPGGTNDVHGCGAFGTIADPSCAPFDRRIGFADCAATRRWRCGTIADRAREASIVTKAGWEEGGVLCCKD